MKKYLPYIITVFVVLFVVGGVFLWKKNKTQKKNEIIQTPPSIKKINDLELSKRPYIALLPHPNYNRCSGVDMIIENLKNKEEEVEYEIEYFAGSLIQGVFGRRSFLDKNVRHQPLEFGSCSKGKCKCDKGITGGNLTLSFATPSDEYTLKSDFSLQTTGKGENKLTSTDARLQVDAANALPKNTQVIIMKTMGLPAKVEGEVIAGPYGVFAPKGIKATALMAFALQTKETGRLLFWNGTRWQKLDTKTNNSRLTGQLPDVGVVVMVK